MKDTKYVVNLLTFLIRLMKGKTQIQHNTRTALVYNR